MKYIFALVVLMFSSLSYAYDFENCKVVEIVTSGQVNAHVALDCVIQNLPACATANRYIGFDKTTAAGEIYFSMILTAFASNSTLTGHIHPSECPSFQNNVALLTQLRMRK
ncbi:hypothetical protein [Sessilibacter sp. MAH4]